jgi:hypothetical protein
MTQHTPGPWAATGWEMREVSAHGHTIALCLGGNSAEAARMARANAALIAAAPDMLAALEAILSCADARDSDSMANAMTDARAVITKAKGGAA